MRGMARRQQKAPEDGTAQRILSGQTAHRIWMLNVRNGSGGHARRMVGSDYIRVQVCDLQRILRTQPCIFSEAPLIDALPL